MTDAAIGHGATFGISDDQTVTGVFANLAEVVDISGISVTRDAIDATHMGSSNNYREFIPGLIDAGEVQLSLNYVPAAADAIRSALETGQGGFKISFNDSLSTTVTFLAIVTNYSIENPMADKRTASATFKINGQPTWA